MYIGSRPDVKALTVPKLESMILSLIDEGERKGVPSFFSFFFFFFSLFVGIKRENHSTIIKLKKKNKAYQSLTENVIIYNGYLFSKMQFFLLSLSAPNHLL